MNKKNIIKNTNELKEFSKNFLKNLKNQKDKATIITLSGDLGAGKTTFVQKIAENLNIKDNINSPTFTISKKYNIKNNNNFENLIHLDLYRLKKESELNFIGLIEEIKNPKNIIFIEWPDIASKILPKEIIKISIKILDQDSREFNF